MTSWPTSTGPAPRTARPRRSTAGSSTSAARPSASATSPTTSPDPYSRPAASNPDYTLHCVEPDYVHFAPTSGSWLNLVEVWFGIIERQAIRRGAFPFVRDLTPGTRTLIDGWNCRRHPFIWTKTPEEILAKINRKCKQTSTTSH